VVKGGERLGLEFEKMSMEESAKGKDE